LTKLFFDDMDAGVFVADCEDGDDEDAAETEDATEADVDDVGGVDGDARSFETSYWMVVPSVEDVSKCLLSLEKWTQFT